MFDNIPFLTFIKTQATFFFSRFTHHYLIKYRKMNRIPKNQEMTDISISQKFTSLMNLSVNKMTMIDKAKNTKYHFIYILNDIIRKHLIKRMCLTYFDLKLDSPPF